MKKLNVYIYLFFIFYFFKCQVKGDSVDVAGRKLKEVHSQYQEKTKEFDRLYEAFTKTSQVGGVRG